MRRVEDIMTRRVVYVRVEDSMETIRDIMEVHGVRHIPVLDNDRVVGVVSRTDVLGFAESQYRTSLVNRAIGDSRMEETFVAEVMTRDVRTVRPEMPLVEAAEVLMKHRVGCLPVTTGDGVLLGIVTQYDFLKMLAELLRSAS